MLTVTTSGPSGRAEGQLERRVRERTEELEAFTQTVSHDLRGIAPKHHQRIFEVFERVPGSEGYSGSGFGLSIVKKAVARMGGHIGLESAPGEGTTFWIELATVDS